MRTKIQIAYDALIKEREELAEKIIQFEQKIDSLKIKNLKRFHIISDNILGKSSEQISDLLGFLLQKTLSTSEKYKNLQEELVHLKKRSEILAEETRNMIVNNPSLLEYITTHRVYSPPNKQEGLLTGEMLDTIHDIIRESAGYVPDIINSIYLILGLERNKNLDIKLTKMIKDFRKSQNVVFSQTIDFKNVGGVSPEQSERRNLFKQPPVRGKSRSRSQSEESKKAKYAKKGGKGLD